LDARQIIQVGHKLLVTLWFYLLCVLGIVSVFTGLCSTICCQKGEGALKNLKLAKDL
jgi:hypothetical protein